MKARNSPNLTKLAPHITRMNWLMKSLMQPIASACLAGLVLTSAATAQEPDREPDPGRVRENLETAAQELSRAQERKRALEIEVAKALDLEKQASDRLVEAGKAITALESSLATGAAKLQSLEQENRILVEDLASRKDQLSELLAALQVLERNPPPALIVAPNDVLGALRGAMMFGAVVPQMHEEAERLATRLERLSAIASEADRQRSSMQQQLASLNTAYHELEMLHLSKRKTAGETSRALEDEQRAITRLSKQAANLQQLLDGLSRADSARREKETAEEKLRQQERERQLAARERGAFDMAKMKGRLDLPADGTISRKFGEDDGFGSRMNGFALATAKRAQVRSPITGRVEFAGHFRSYGQVLIIEARGGYVLVLAGMEEILPVRGQSVTTGEPVGRMGDRQASAVVAGRSEILLTPVLYVELRHNGKPVDSRPWWAGTRKEARQ
jgi:murein hydrolase activator